MIVAINKPKGPTSHDMIYAVRRITHIKRVGHGGTLDPAASGVLVVAITRESTKKLTGIINYDKEYIATIRLGATSTTDDGEGEINEVGSMENEVRLENIQAVLPQFTGEINQVPPMYSAIKKNGQKLYDLARKGKTVELEPRPVTIDAITIESYSWPELIIKVHCHKGVYIRSLARDIGATLKVGGYLTDLKRIRVGDYTIDQSMTIDEFEQYWKAHTNCDSQPSTNR